MILHWQHPKLINTLDDVLTLCPNEFSDEIVSDLAATLTKVYIKKAQLDAANKAFGECVEKAARLDKAHDDLELLRQRKDASTKGSKSFFGLKSGKVAIETLQIELNEANKKFRSMIVSLVSIIGGDFASLMSRLDARLKSVAAQAKVVVPQTAASSSSSSSSSPFSLASSLLSPSAPADIFVNLPVLPGGDEALARKYLYLQTEKSWQINITIPYVTPLSNLDGDSMKVSVIYHQADVEDIAMIGKLSFMPASWYMSGTFCSASYWYGVSEVWDQHCMKSSLEQIQMVVQTSKRMSTSDKEDTASMNSQVSSNPRCAHHVLVGFHAPDMINGMEEILMKVFDIDKDRRLGTSRRGVCTIGKRRAIYQGYVNNMDYGIQGIFSADGCDHPEVVFPNDGDSVKCDFDNELVQRAHVAATYVQPFLQAKYKDSKGSYNPAEWNVDFCLKVLGRHFKPGDCVYLPYAGSGSAAVAAVLLGINTVLVDSDPAMSNLVKERVLDIRSEMHRKVAKKNTAVSNVAAGEFSG